jgi:hypothetical protein
MAITITAPSPIDGVQSYGPYNIPFEKGVAVVKDLPLGVELYMLDAGYKIDKPKPRSRKADPDASEVETPEVETPEVETPEVEVSEVSAEQETTPDLTVGVDPDATPAKPAPKPRSRKA